MEASIRASSALRFPQRIGEQQAGLAGFLVGTPPGVDGGDGFGFGGPAEDRQAEGGFGDEGVAAERFEGLAGGVGIELVIAGDHPHFSALLEADLRGAQDVAGGMERNADGAEGQGFAIVDRLDGGFIA